MLVFAGIGRNASTRYRVRYPIEALGWVEGTDYQVGVRVQQVLQGRKWVDTNFPAGTTTLVVCRPHTKDGLALMSHARQQGIRVIADFDDHFARIPPSHAGYQALQGRPDPNAGWRWADRCAQAADKVIVSSPALAKRYMARQVIPNYLPHERFERPIVEPEPVVGWAAHVVTHPEDPSTWDFQQIRDWLEGRGMRLAHVGQGDVGATDELGPLTPDDYISTMASWTASLVPLKACEFNDAKSALKGLESMSLGVPAVASPRAEYKRLDGCLPAETTEEVIASLDEIIGDPGRREQARKHAHEWCLEFHADEWERAWTG